MKARYDMKWKWLGALALAALFWGMTAGATSLEVFPDRPSDMNSVIMENPPRSDQEARPLDLYVRVDCYGTNLRSVARPLSPSSILDVTFMLSKRIITGGVLTGTENFDIQFQFPTLTFFGLGTLGVNQFTFVNPNPVPGDWSRAYDPATRFFVVRTTQIGAAGHVSSDGRVTLTQMPISVRGVQVRQFGINPRGQYVEGGGVDGYRRVTVADDGSAIYFYLNAPGAAGFCGGYYSPLMVFFDDRRPVFSGKSRFPLNPLGGMVGWPEPKAPGYFLALDRNGNGKIDEAGELFGSAEAENGFEALKKLDRNRDNLIDVADAEFTRLLLWQDANGDGETQTGELHTLADKGVVSINLDYVGDEVRPTAGNAEERQRGTFTFRSQGKLRKGEVVDYWFRPVRGTAPPSFAAK